MNPETDRQNFEEEEEGRAGDQREWRMKQEGEKKRVMKGRRKSERKRGKV